MYSLVLYNERDISPIQYTNNMNGTASLVDAIKEIQGKKTVPKYKTNDIVKKQDLLKKTAQQYKTMDSDDKSC